MKVLSNYDFKYKRSTLSEGLFDLLIAEILSADENSELILVSPWMRNIDFNTSSRGEIRQILEYKPTRLSLDILLAEFLKRGGSIKIVCLPPHRLVSQDVLDTINELIEIREIVDEMDVKRRLNDQITKQTSKALVNQTMLEFIAELKKTYKEKIKIIYNSKLHAKIYLGKNLGILGSANMTHYGFKISDEVCLFFNDPDVIRSLKDFISQLSIRYHSDQIEEYSFSKYIQIPPNIKSMHPEIERLLITINENLSTEKVTEYFFDDEYEV